MLFGLPMMVGQPCDSLYLDLTKRSEFISDLFLFPDFRCGCV